MTEKTKKTKKEKPKPQAMEAALRILSRKEVTEAEMRRSLLRREYTEEEAQDAIARLLEYHYLDDVRYARLFFSYAFGKNWGRRRAAQELRKKGVADETIRAALEELEEEAETPDEFVLAKRAADRVLRMAELGPADPVPQKVSARIARRLAGRGFRETVIYEVLRGLPRERGE